MGTRVQIGALGLHDDNFRSVPGLTLEGAGTDGVADASLDLLVSEGTSVLPVADGRVVASWKDCDMALVEHEDGTLSEYLHIAPIVELGAHVSTTTVLGTVLPTATPQAVATCKVKPGPPHLHLAFLSELSGSSAGYVSMVGRTFCGHRVDAEGNIVGLGDVSGDAFEVPECGRRQACSPAEIAEGNVLYQADWTDGFDCWWGSDSWTVRDGQLVNDGAEYASSHDPTIRSGAAPATPDYAVEVEIRLIRYTDEGAPFTAQGAFGANLRIDGTESYRFVFCNGIGLLACGSTQKEAMISTRINQPIAEASFDPGLEWHLYRFEVDGLKLRYLVDGRLVTETEDSRLVSPGQIGLFSNRAQIAIRAFRVLRL